jgi:Fic family protein
MTKLVKEMKTPVRPPGGFTRSEYEQQAGIGTSAANHHLQKLQALGKVKKLGTTGKNCFYVLV